MEKIGILTYHRAYSYGAKLQAYALATYLTSIGFEAEVIDYGNIGEEKLRKIGTKSLKDFIVTTLCYIASSIAEPQRILTSSWTSYLTRPSIMTRQILQRPTISMIILLQEVTKYGTQNTTKAT